MSGAGAQAVARALARARHFLASAGAAREGAYVAALAGAESSQGFAAAAAAAQDARGAIAPLLAGDPPGPGVASTADALGWLAALSLTEGAPVDRAAAFLAGAQEEDGGWSDPSAADDETRLALSARVAGLLARCPAVRLSVLRRAGAHLASRWSIERVQTGSFPAIAGYLHAFASLPDDLDVADEALQWCGRELERGFRTRVFSAVHVGRLLSLCDAAAVPGARLGAEEIALALLTEQAEDGGFGAGAERVRDTCEAAAALASLRAALR